MLNTVNKVVNADTINLYSRCDSDCCVIQNKDKLNCNTVSTSNLDNYIGDKLLVIGNCSECCDFVNFYNLIEFSLYDNDCGSDFMVDFDRVVDYFSMSNGEFESRNQVYWFEHVVCKLFDDLADILSSIVDINGIRVNYFISTSTIEDLYRCKRVDPKLVTVKFSQPLLTSVKKYLVDNNIQLSDPVCVKCLDMCSKIDKFYEYDFGQYFVNVNRSAGIVNDDDSIFKTSNFII